MNVYLDTCALGRLFDDQTQPRMRAEATAVSDILQRVSAGTLQWSSSAILVAEILRNRDSLRRSATLVLLRAASSTVPFSPQLARRATQLRSLGIHAVDALHLSAAELASAEVFLTTDDRLIRRSAHLRLRNLLTLPVLNPVHWLGGEHP